MPWSQPAGPAVHEIYMRQAFKEAEKAAAKNEVPCGAVIVQGGRILAKAHNLRETNRSVLAHAEILAIGKACKKIGSWRLEDCDIYVTKEPCPMCAGAIFQARFRRLIFGPYDAKGGAAGSLFDLVNDKRLNHQVEVISGIMEKENTKMLSDFFKAIRQRNARNT